MAAIVDAVPPQAVLVSFDYPTSMALEYEIWRRHGGLPRLLAMPETALGAPFATDRLRRQLLGGAPFRIGPRDELVAPQAPLLCTCGEPALRDALARQGIVARPTRRPGIFRLRATPSPPPVPAAVLVHELQTIPLLREEIAAVTAPGFSPAAKALRRGPRTASTTRTAGGALVLREVSQDALVADVSSPAGGWVVLTDLYASRWRITVDGRDTPGFRADVLFLGLEVPAGIHRVELRRDTRPFHLGLWLRGPWDYLPL
jgi:hypothetical protein